MNKTIVKITFWCTLFLSLILMSCEREPCTCSKDDGEEARTEQFLSLRLNAPNVVTLRASSTNSDPMLSAEKLRFLFYKGEAGSEVVAQIVEKIFTSSMKDGFQLKLVPDDYKLVVLANPSQKLLELTAAGSPLTKLTEAQPISTLNFLNIEGESFTIPMANEQGVIEVHKSDFHATNTIASGLPVTEVQLESMLARVLVFGTPEINGTQPVGLEPKFLINNMASSVAPLRPLHKLRTGENEQVGDNSAKADRYAFSTLWEQWASSTPTNTELIGSYPKKAFAVNDNWAPMKKTVAEYETILNKQRPLYVKETTLPPTAYLQGLAPCVIIKYPYAPKGITLNGQEGWLSYEGRYYTETKAKELLASSESSALKTALTTAGITSDSFSEAFSKSGINFYYQSYNYYVVYIRHFAEATEKNAYGRYGVVRGNEYRIEIKSIQDAGTPLAPELKGNISPIAELESKGMQVKISELVTRSQEASL